MAVDFISLLVIMNENVVVFWVFKVLFKII